VYVYVYVCVYVCVCVCVCVRMCACKKRGESCVYQAIDHSAGSIDIVRVLVELNADVNRASEYGSTPVHVAAYYANMEILTYLVEECHATIYTRTTNGKTPIGSAPTAEIADYLRKHMQPQMIKEFTHTNVLPFVTDVLKIIISYL